MSGWNIALDETATHREFYAYHLFDRKPQSPHTGRNGQSIPLPLNTFNSILHSGRLLQEYAVTQWAKVEQSHLNFIRTNQKNLRKAIFDQARDALHNQNNESMNNVGQRVILPATFVGSPRYMTQRYFDAMAVVAKFGKPDLFITFTCNPDWPEIQDNLAPGEKAYERPDLCSRVFHMYLQEFLKDLIERGVLGKVIGYAYTIEWQKRSLPHCHITLILAPGDKIESPQDIDRVVSAELPQPEDVRDTSQNELLKLVLKHQIHGPCLEDRTQPCLDTEGVCTRQYPKQFSSETLPLTDGYPTYRRRAPKLIQTEPRNKWRFKFRVTRTVKGRKKKIDIDNSYVVPYNPYLLLKYRAHINVEVVTNTGGVKYLYKYVYKGNDRVMYSIVLKVNRNISIYRVWEKNSRLSMGNFVFHISTCTKKIPFPTIYCMLL
jgi:hypothetical protein